MKNILHSFLKGFSKYKYLTILIKMMWTIAFFSKHRHAFWSAVCIKKTYFWNICSQIWKLSLSSINPIPTYVWFTSNPPSISISIWQMFEKIFSNFVSRKIALLPYWVLRNFGKQILIKRLIKCVNRMN